MTAHAVNDPWTPAADNDWPAALYEPRRTCPLCHEPLVCVGYADAVPGFRTWRYELPCGCYRGLASNDVLPAAKKPRAKRVVMVQPRGASVRAAAGGVKRTVKARGVLVTEPPLGVGVDYVWRADALDLLRALPAGSVDMIFIDPPYNMTSLDFEGFSDWSAFWLEARRVLKHKKSPVLSFSQQPFTTDLINSNRKGFRYEIIIEKTMPVGFLDANRRPMRCHENLLVFADAMPDYYPEMEKVEATTTRHHVHDGGRADHYGKHGVGRPWQDSGLRYPRDVWRFAQRDTAFERTTTLHPTQKPLDCVEKAIRMFSCAGDLIVDCFCGSGTTAVAARANKRHSICCDNGVNERTGQPWAQVSRERLAVPYTPLFDALATLP